MPIELYCGWLLASINLIPEWSREQFKEDKKEKLFIWNQGRGINLNSFFPCNQLTATSYIYQCLGDVEWYVEMKQSAWQQWARCRFPPSPGRSQWSESGHWDIGDRQVGRWSEASGWLLYLSLSLLSLPAQVTILIIISFFLKRHLTTRHSFHRNFSHCTCKIKIS